MGPWIVWPGLAGPSMVPWMIQYGDQLWQGGTNYGAMDGPARPTKVPQVVRGTTCGSHNRSGDRLWGDQLWRDSTCGIYEALITQYLINDNSFLLSVCTKIFTAHKPLYTNKTKTKSGWVFKQLWYSYDHYWFIMVLNIIAIMPYLQLYSTTSVTKHCWRLYLFQFSYQTVYSCTV